MRATCPSCNGKGSVIRSRICVNDECGEIRDWCPDCQGAGYVKARPACYDRSQAVAACGEDWYTAEDAENGYVPTDATWLR